MTIETPNSTSYLTAAAMLVIDIESALQTQGDKMTKIGGILPEIFDVFTFSIQPIFHLEKEEQVV